MAHFWNHLGKAALVAAPYIAAPFTGGASLALTGVANAAEQRWAAHDAQKAIERGEQPSQFDRWLGLGANVAGIASGVGALGSSLGAGATLAGTLGNAASTGTRVANIANLGSNALGTVGQVQGINAANSADNNTTKSTNRAAKGIGPSSNPTSYTSGPTSSFAQSMGGKPGSNPNVMPEGGYSYRDNPMNQVNQRSPNMAQSIFQGRQEAMQNQPFRSGYQTNYLGSDDRTPLTAQMPPISPNIQPTATPEVDPSAPVDKSAQYRPSARKRSIFANA